MAGLARWAYTHRVTVVLLWLLALLGLGAADRLGGSAYSDSFSLPGSPSTRALELLRASFPSASGDSDTIVWRVSSGSVTDPAVHTRITAMLDKVAAIPGVASVTSPYGAGQQGQISRDRTTAFTTVHFTQSANEVPAATVARVIDTAMSARTTTLEVELGGPAIAQEARQAPVGAEVIGVLAAAVILLIAFGSLLAMILPVVTAVLALGVGVLTIGMLSRLFGIATFAPTLAALIALGVGIDYALFVVTRHRNGIKSGLLPAEAVSKALDTSGRAVIFAGGTVCVALLGLLVLRVSFLNGVAVAAAVAVLISVLAAITLLPALLGFLGMRALNRRERRELEVEGPHEPHARGFGARWAKLVQNRPRPLAVAALVVMVLLVIPVSALRLGSSDAGNDPASSTTRKAYDMLAAGFGPGFNGPLQLVAELPGKGPVAGLQPLIDAVGGTQGVASVSPATASPDGTVAIIQVIPTTAPQDKATSDLIQRLRTDVIPNAVSGIPVYVGGQTAIFDDFATVLTGKLPMFIGVIVALGCLLLLIAFRSLLVPLTAAVMNLLAAGAAFGVLVAVFQWGWGASLIGAGRAGPIEAFLPVILLAILFGLSMDYQVFLVSRMHEEWVHTGDSPRAVRVGQADTGRVITAAATIMICVFSSFVLGGQRVIAEFGVGLAAAVFLDAFVLRTVLVPAAMNLFGRANWWIPRWLDRVMPQLSVEPVEDRLI